MLYRDACRYTTIPPTSLFPPLRHPRHPHRRSFSFRLFLSSLFLPSSRVLPRERSVCVYMSVYERVCVCICVRNRVCARSLPPSPSPSPPLRRPPRKSTPLHPAFDLSFSSFRPGAGDVGARGASRPIIIVKTSVFRAESAGTT